LDFGFWPEDEFYCTWTFAYDPHLPGVREALEIEEWLRSSNGPSGWPTKRSYAQGSLSSARNAPSTFSKGRAAVKGPFLFDFFWINTLSGKP
jgi:hypothetical protein